MSKVIVLEYGNTRNRKNIPIKFSLNCSCCGKEIIIEYKNGNWPKSGSSMKRIFEASNKNTEIDIFCSRSCSNIKRNHSYMNKINKTFEIKCIDCDEFNDCLFKNKNNGIQKGSLSVNCYTKKNLTDKKILEWRNSEENKNRWAKVGKDYQEYLRLIYNNSEIHNPNYYKAKEFCENNLDLLYSKRGIGFISVVYKRDISGYITHINDIPINEYIKSIKKLKVNFIPEGFRLIPTYRDQDSTIRNSLLDDYLVKNNIKWFVYIKYDELGHPLVVGKSGSKLVNISGCDVIFDKNPDGGPARQYLIENNLDWNKTQIAISKSFDLEKDALIYEYVTCRKYELFSS